MNESKLTLTVEVKSWGAETSRQEEYSGSSGMRGLRGSEELSSYLQDIRATGHRDSYDSPPSRTRQLFCDGLVAFVLAPVSLLLFICALSLAVAVPAPWSFAPVSTARISERAARSEERV